MAKRRKKAKKKAKKHAKPKHASHASHAPRVHKAKQSNIKYIVGALIVLAIILYVLFGGEEAPVPEPVVTEPEEPTGELEPSEVEVSQGYTKTRESVSVGTEQLEGSFFGGVKCGKDAGTDEKDILEYQLKNMADVPFVLRHVKVAEMNQVNPLRVSINGHNLRKGVVEKCGKDTIEPGELLNCKTEVNLRHFGVTGKKSENILKAEGRVSGQSNSMVSVFKFYC